MQHHLSVGVLHAGDSRFGDQRQRLLEVTLGLLLLGAIGEAADHGPQLVDDLRMPGAKGDMGLGVIWRQLQRLLKACLDLVANSLREGLGDGDHLTVATECQRVEIPGVGVLGLAFLQLLGMAGRPLEGGALGILVFQQIAGVDHQRLVCHIEARLTGRFAKGDGPGKIPGMIGPPGILYLFILGPGFGIPLMETIPVVRQLLASIVIGRIRVGEGDKFEL